MTKFIPDDGLRQSKPIERLVLKTRDLKHKVTLVGNNWFLRLQIRRNRQLRRMLGNEKASSVLRLLCEVDGEKVRLDTGAILVTYFAPRTEAEKFLIRESEIAFSIAAWREKDNPDLALEQRTYGEEMLFLAICGLDGLMLAKTQPVQTKEREVFGRDVLATWNTSEPTIGLFPNDRM